MPRSSSVRPCKGPIGRLTAAAKAIVSPMVAPRLASISFTHSFLHPQGRLWRLGGAGSSGASPAAVLSRCRRILPCVKASDEIPRFARLRPAHTGFNARIVTTAERAQQDQHYFGAVSARSPSIKLAGRSCGDPAILITTKATRFGRRPPFHLGIRNYAAGDGYC